MSRVYGVILGFSAVLLVFICLEWPGKQVELVFCDVGQGDATLIQDGFTQVLVDAGPDEKVMGCLEKVMPFWDKQIEFVVLTHPDNDHSGGLPQVFSQYKVKYLVTDLSVKKTPQYDQVRQAFIEEVKAGARVLLPRVGGQFRAGRVVFDIWQSEKPQQRVASITETELWANFEQGQGLAEGENNDSIVLFGRFNTATFLLTGDLEKEGELALLKYPLTTKTKLLKAGHHGSKTSSIEPFIAAVEPEKVVISSGKNNRYGHPAPEVMATLGKSGALLYRTDQQSTVHFTSFGTTWNIRVPWEKWLLGFFCKRASIFKCVTQ